MNMFTSGDRTNRAARLTPKAQQTRAAIVAAALSLFRERGFAATTLRDIAAEAGVSLGLSYRYFRSKEELVLALYEDVATRVLAHVPKLPVGSTAERFAALMEHKLRVLSPNKEAFAALLVAAIDPASKVSVLSDASQPIREAMRGAFTELVVGASDAPPAEQVQPLVLALYAAHLGLLLAWVHDKSRGAKQTGELIALVRDAFALVRPFLAAPGAERVLARVLAAVAPLVWKEKK